MRDDEQPLSALRGHRDRISMHLRKARYGFTWRLRCRPVLYPAAISLRPRKRGLLVRKSTDIVIEGYPRSGNSFAVQAFQSMNDGARIAHHLHAPVQVSRAVSYGVPLVVLLRSPEDAVASALVQAAFKSPREALKEWIAFYTCVLRAGPRLVLAPFEDVTSDFASVIRRVNETFRCDFIEYENKASRDEVIFAEIDRGYKASAKPLPDAKFEEFIGRPSPHRAPLLELAGAEIRENKDCEDLLLAARRIYAQLRDTAR